MVHEVEMLFHASLPSAPNNEGSHAEITIMQHENDAAFPLSPSQRPSSNAVPGGKKDGVREPRPRATGQDVAQEMERN